MTVFNARALGSLVTVAGSALSKRLTVILSALVQVLENPGTKEDEELEDAVNEAVSALLSSICDAEGLNTLMLLLLGWYVTPLSNTSPGISHIPTKGETRLGQPTSQRMQSFRHIL